MSRIWIGIVSLAVALLVTVAFYARRMADRHEAALKVAEASLGHLRSQVEAIDWRPAPAPGGSAPPQGIVAERPDASPARQRKAFPGGRLSAHYTENPGLTKAAYVPLVRKYFTRFYAEAGLSGAQVDAFETLLGEGGPLLEFFLSSGPSATSMSPSDLEGIARAQADQIDAVIKSVEDLLGEAVARKFEATFATRGAQDIIDQIAVHGFHAGAPLSALQSERLFQLLIEADPSPVRGRAELETLDWPRVIQAASGFLTPAQLRPLEALRAKAAFDREYRRFTGFAAGENLPTLEP